MSLRKGALMKQLLDFVELVMVVMVRLAGAILCVGAWVLLNLLPPTMIAPAWAGAYVWFVAICMVAGVLILLADVKFDEKQGKAVKGGGA